MTSPVLAAVYRGDRAAVDQMLAAGATLTLCEAAALGDAPRVRALARAEPAAVARRSPDGWPALHLAAHFGHGDAVDALLAAGADVNARAGGGSTALHVAAFGGDVALINTLLAHGADPEALADDGKTALAIAADKGHAQAARRLRGEMP